MDDWVPWDYDYAVTAVTTMVNTTTLGVTLPRKAWGLVKVGDIVWMELRSMYNRPGTYVGVVQLFYKSKSLMAGIPSDWRIDVGELVTVRFKHLVNPEIKDDGPLNITDYRSFRKRKKETVDAEADEESDEESDEELEEEDGNHSGRPFEVE